jgi:hypothetical protein
VLLQDLKASAERRAEARVRSRKLTRELPAVPAAHALPRRRPRRQPTDPIQVIDSNQGLTVGEILDATANAGFGFVAGLLALVAIPFVGLSTPFGLAVAFVGAQIMAGKARPWLPDRVRRRPMTVAHLDTLVRWMSRLTGWMVHLVRPRWPAMTSRVGFVLVGLGLVVQGVGLALPLPIPGSNWPFIAAILVYAIGVLDDDGVLIALAHVATLAAGFAAFELWRSACGAIGHAWSWLT